MNMRIVFFGSDHFARTVLTSLLEKGVEVIAVVTRPDKPKGRSGQATPPPLLEGGFTGKVFQPEKASSEDFIGEMRQLEPDLFVVVSYGQIMKQPLLDVPRLGTINVHPSLLPKFRGPSPIQSTVLAGEKEAGVTIMKMVLAMDAGPILRVRKMDLPEDMTFGELEERLVEISKDLLYEVLNEMEKKGDITATPQDEKFATYTKKIQTEDSFIDWKLPAICVHNFIRGMNPRPGARVWMQLKGEKKIVKILRSKITDLPTEGPGKIISFNPKEGFIVSCVDFCLEILEVQLEGKRKMNSIDFINGFSFPTILS